MNPETARRLGDARRYAQDVRRFTEGATAESFLENRGLQLVVHKLLEIVGEALGAAKESEADIAGEVDGLDGYIALREHLLVEYDLVQYDSLWNTTQRDIPALIASLDTLLGDASLPVPEDSPNP
jgi:uncharacterized protein with HEPN domain